MTIYHVAGKSSVVADALLHFPDLAIVFGPVESNSLTWIHEA